MKNSKVIANAQKLVEKAEALKTVMGWPDEWVNESFGVSKDAAILNMLNDIRKLLA